MFNTVDLNPEHTTQSHSCRSQTSHYRTTNYDPSVCLPGHSLQLLEEVSLHHGDLVNDQVAALSPLVRHSLSLKGRRSKSDIRGGGRWWCCKFDHIIYNYNSK